MQKIYFMLLDVSKISSGLICLDCFEILSRV